MSFFKHSYLPCKQVSQYLLSFRYNCAFMCLVKLPSCIFKLSVIILITTTLGLSGQVREQEEIINFLHKSFQIKDQVWDIETNSVNGFTYFATSQGLLQYDGLAFSRNESSETKQIRAVKIDTNGVIFTGGFESFGYWSQDNDCRYEYHPLSDSVLVSKNDEIWKIHLYNHEVIFQSFTALYIYNYKTIRKVEVPGFMIFMFRVNGQFIAQVLDQGLFTYQKEVFQFIEGSEVFIDVKIHDIVSFDSTSFLICTDKSGIFKYSNKDFTYWDSPASKFLQSYSCNAAIAPDDSSFVFGSILNGIILTNHKGVILQQYNYGNGLGNNTVLSLHSTNTGGIWIGLDEGTNYISKQSNITYYNTPEGSLGTIYSLLLHNQTLYLGSNHGLFRTDISQKGSNLSFSPLKFIPRSQGQVWTLAQFDGEILCGHNEGTFKILDDKIEKISGITGGWTIKPYDDLLLEGTYTGLITFKKDRNGKWEYHNRLEGFYEPSRHIEIDYLGYIWVSHPQKGIFRLKLNEARDSVQVAASYTRLKKKLGLTDVFKINNRIVFSTGVEFFTYDYVNDSIVPFDVLNKTLGEYKQSQQIVHHDKNLYWFVNRNKLALFRFSLEFESTLVNEYNLVEGNLPGQDLAILPINFSDFLISNRNGLALLQEPVDREKEILRSIVVRKAFFQGRNKSITYCEDIQDMRAPYFMNNVTFSFSDPSSIDLSGTNYKYRIHEIDADFIPANFPEIRYYHLKPGTYHLEIISDVDAAQCKLVFTIKPPWYFTSWAYVSYFLLVLLIIRGFYAYFHIKLEKQKKLIEFELKQTSLENRLQNTNVELMLSLRYLIQKNETLENLQREIQILQESPGNVPAKFIKNMDAHITQGLELQTTEWKMAVNNLKLSQEGYFKRLKEKYPRLTNHDIRLCSYLRMNFTSKEIAHLLNISIRAVEIGRYRLRKKLELEHDINLTDFLMQDGI